MKATYVTIFRKKHDEYYVISAITTKTGHEELHRQTKSFETRDEAVIAAKKWARELGLSFMP